ncbi:TPA: elastin-binding protein EbpS [Staphylococcus aureus]|nr:elastin-binding protein EbpS [Staphylococcus aureus]
MSNNFKDDFEKNRQSIDTNSHQDHTVEKDQSELEHQDTIENTEQQFPPRNAQRRKRRRDLATNHNKQVHNESQTSEDNVQNEAGPIDDRQVESSHSTESQEPSHQDSTPQHEEEYYNKNAFAMDKSHPEPIEDNDKHETIKDAENNTEHSTVSDKSEAEQSQQPKPYFTTGANQSETSKNEHDNDSVKQDQDEPKEHHNGKKAAAIGAGTAGVAGAAGAMAASKAKKHSNDAQNKSNSGKANNSTEDKASQDKSKDHHNGKKGAAIGAGTAGLAGGAASKSASAASKPHASNNASQNHDEHDNHDRDKERKKGGMAKVLLPLIAAVLIIGALAIFGGMALNNHNNGTKENKIANTNKNNADESKDKDTSKDASKDKSKSTDSDKSKDDQDKATKDESDNDQNNANQANNQAQNNQNQQQANQNQQQQQQRQGGGQRHTVNGQENLYRIAIQYYGSGSPENVEKIRRANGLSGNNIRNGQQIVIP